MVIVGGWYEGLRRGILSLLGMKMVCWEISIHEGLKVGNLWEFTRRFIVNVDEVSLIERIIA